jgi:hypothetical protein
MTRLTLPYIHRFRDRHGHLRYYFRRDGKRRTLPGLPGSAEFMAAYQAAEAGLPTSTGASRVLAGTLDALIVAYYVSAGFRQLADSTKATIAASSSGSAPSTATSGLPPWSRLTSAG